MYSQCFRGSVSEQLQHTQTVTKGNFILEAFAIVVFGPGCDPTMSKERHSHRRFVLHCVHLLFLGCEVFRFSGERNSGGHHKSKHFRIRVGEFGVSSQEW